MVAGPLSAQDHIPQRIYFQQTSSVAAGFPQLKMWRGTCRIVGVRIAAARSMTTSSGEAPGANSVRQSMSFLALLNLAAAQSAATEDAAAGLALPAKSNPEADTSTAETQDTAPSGATSAPEQIARLPRSQPDSPASQAQPIPSVVPTRPGSGKVPDAIDREPKVQSSLGTTKPSNAAAPAAEASSTPAVAAATNGVHAAAPAAMCLDGVKPAGTQAKSETAAGDAASVAPDHVQAINVVKPPASAQGDRAVIAGEEAGGPQASDQMETPTQGTVGDCHLAETAADAMTAIETAALPLAPMPISGPDSGLISARANPQPGRPSLAQGADGANQPNGSSGASAVGNGKDKANEANTSGSGTAAHGSTSNTAVVQRADAALSQSDLSSSRPANSALPQAPAIATQAVPHAPEAAAGQTGSGSKAAEAAEAPAQAPELPATSTVNTAGVMQRMSETEMRVAVHSADFGAVSIRASLSPQQMMAQISVDHSDLGRELSNQASAMEARLGSELGLRATVHVSQSTTAFSGGGGNSGESDQSSFKTLAVESRNLPAQQTQSDEANLSGNSGLNPALAGNRSDRLDIHA
jgi:hypothetical protein